MAKKQELQPITLEDVRILFRNFSGLPGRFNAAGNRNFNVAIDEKTAAAMLQDGWNIKYLQPREEGDPIQAILEVRVHYSERGAPPRIVMITSRGKTNLDESMVALLDWADIVNVDLIIRPYEWEVSGRTGIKAYLKSLYVTIREDDLEKKYLDVPDSAQTAIVGAEDEGEGG